MTEEEWLTSTDFKAMWDHIGLHGELKERFVSYWHERVEPSFRLEAEVMVLSSGIEVINRTGIELFHEVIGNPFQYEKFFHSMRSPCPINYGKGHHSSKNHLSSETVWNCEVCKGREFVLPFWVTSEIKELAQYAYDNNDFSGLPILADALEDAGYREQSVLQHLRSNNTHVRRCWVLDLIRGEWW